ncbi:MAG: hypothetical protein GY775_13150 [Candidatus Scalindua sp.]|nr:hypothetical protein [Candidatus Scalindua sp.]
MRRDLKNIIKGNSLLIVFAVLMLNVCFSAVNTFGNEPEAKTEEAVTEGKVAVSPTTEEAAVKERKGGECTEGDCENGRGTMVYPDGTKYKGEFKAGRRSGQGTYTYSDGGNYTGEWRDNLRHGKGTDTFTNGVIYEGEWVLSKRHGQGKLTMPDLGTYEGEWKEDKKQGQGTFVFVEGDKYEGEWSDGMCNGHGTRTFSNGNRYEGEWKDFAATGGWYYWPKGNKTWSYMDENWEWIHEDLRPE